MGRLPLVVKCSAAGNAAPPALQVGKDAVAALAMQRLEMLSEQLFVVHFDLQRVAYDIVQTISARRTIICKLSPEADNC